MPFGLNAPGSYRFDANLSKRFKLTETKSIQFRLDALNVFNHPSPGDPQPRTAGGQSINTPGIIFGQIPDKAVLGSGASPQMRYITGQLRLDF